MLCASPLSDDPHTVSLFSDRHTASLLSEFLCSMVKTNCTAALCYHIESLSLASGQCTKESGRLLHHLSTAASSLHLSAVSLSCLTAPYCSASVVYPLITLYLYCINYALNHTLNTCHCSSCEFLCCMSTQ